MTSSGSFVIFPFAFRATPHLEYIVFAWCEVGTNSFFFFFPCDYLIDSVQLIKNVSLSLLICAATFVRSECPQIASASRLSRPVSVRMRTKSEQSQAVVETASV